MDLRSLYYFVTVAEERNITRAAERCSGGQSRFSSWQPRPSTSSNPWRA